jgi:REP element-mobilizing transposase RayT
VHNLPAHPVLVTRYRRGVLDTQMLNRCEQLMAQVCADFGASLAGLNGAEDHVHLLAAYPPKVALSHFANSRTPDMGGALFDHGCCLATVSATPGRSTCSGT